MLYYGPQAKVELKRGNLLQFKLPTNAIVKLHTDDFFNFMYGPKSRVYRLKKGRGELQWLNSSEAGFSINNVEFTLGRRALETISKKLGLEEMKTVDKMIEQTLKGKSAQRVVSEATSRDVAHYMKRHPELLKIRALVSALEDRRHPKKGLFAGTIGSAFGVSRAQARSANVRDLFLMVVDHAEYELDSTDVRDTLNSLLLNLESMWLRSSLPQEIGDVEDIYELEGLRESSSDNLEESIVISDQGYTREDSARSIEIVYTDVFGKRRKAPFLLMSDLRTICRHYFGNSVREDDSEEECYPDEVVMFHRRKKKR